MSIYSRLFKYPSRPKHTPLENFLTAALADLLNRLPRKRHTEFIADVLLTGSAGEAWLLFMAGKPDASLQWVTQRSVREGHSAGIVDMLLLVDGRERIVVETKVGAAVRGHAALANGDEEEPAIAIADASQLTTYGAWLAGRCQGQDWPGALVLLTHRSEPPHGYGPNGYGVPYVGTCRWWEVWRWTRAVGAEGSNEAGTWAQLSTEFAAFLEAQGMSAEHMTQDDIAQAQVFVTRTHRIQHTFDTVKAKLYETNREIVRIKQKKLITYYDSVGAVAWIWFYLREPTKARWYIAWGIRFPETSRLWNEVEPPLPSEPHVFVTLGSDDGPVPVAIVEDRALPDGWAKASETELIIGRKLSDLPADADMMAAEFANWAAASVTALRPTLAELVKNYKR